MRTCRYEVILNVIRRKNVSLHVLSDSLPTVEGNITLDMDHLIRKTYFSRIKPGYSVNYK